MRMRTGVLPSATVESGVTSVRAVAPCRYTWVCSPRKLRVLGPGRMGTPTKVRRCVPFTPSWTLVPIRSSETGAPFTLRVGTGPWGASTVTEMRSRRRMTLAFSGSLMAPAFSVSWAAGLPPTAVAAARSAGSIWPCRTSVRLPGSVTLRAGEARSGRAPVWVNS